MFKKGTIGDYEYVRSLIPHCFAGNQASQLIFTRHVNSVGRPRRGRVLTVDKLMSFQGYQQSIHYNINHSYKSQTTSTNSVWSMNLSNTFFNNTHSNLACVFVYMYMYVWIHGTALCTSRPCTCIISSYYYRSAERWPVEVWRTAWAVDIHKHWWHCHHHSPTNRRRPPCAVLTADGWMDQCHRASLHTHRGEGTRAGCFLVNRHSGITSTVLFYMKLVVG